MRDADALADWLLERAERDPADDEVAFLLDVATRQPFSVDTTERARLQRLAGLSPPGVRVIILRDAAERLLGRDAAAYARR